MTQVLSNSDMPRATRSGEIDRRLAGAWRREWQFTFTRGLGRLIVWLAAMLAVDFILDWRIDLPGGYRMGLLGLNLAVALGVLFWGTLRHLKGFDPLHVALQVETLYPSLNSLLVSYVQLHEKPEAHAGISPGLVRAMCDEAAVQVKPLDFGKIVRFRTLRKLALIVLLVVGVEAAAGAWQPVFLQTFLARMSDPNSTAEYPTATQVVSVSPGHVTRQQGTNVALSVTVAGVLPEEAVLYVKQDGSPREEIDLFYDRTAQATSRPATTSAPAAPTRTFSYEIEAAAKSFTYWFHAGDVTSKKFRVNMAPPPTLEAQVEIESPSYTKLKPRLTGTAGLDVLTGTKLIWKLKINRPVDSIVLQGVPGGDKAMKISANGLEAVTDAPVVAAEAFSYGFLVRDRKIGPKDSFTYPPEVSYSVSVHPDREPVLVMTTAPEQSAGKIAKKISLGFSAEDDYGIASARIVWWFADSALKDPGAKDAPKRKETVWPVKTYTDAPLQISEQLEWKISKAIPGLKPGDVVEYVVEVEDNCQPKPNVIRSREFRQEVISNADYDRRLAEQRNEIYERMRILAIQEAEAAEKIGMENRVGDATSQPATTQPTTSAAPKP